MILTTVQALIFVLYVGFLLYKFKKPLPSISDSWYELPKNWNNLFTLFTWSLGFCMIFQGTNETPLFFLSGTGLLFVGTATAFKWTGAHTNLVHYGGAVVGILGALVGLGVEFGLWWPLLSWVVVTMGLKYIRIKNFTWWVEIVAFVTIVCGLYLR
jgi:hypothetical protein